MPDQPDPLAAFRALADQYAAKVAESLRNAKASTLDEARTALQDVAAGWAGAEFLLRHTLADLDNSRTTPDNPPACAHCGDPIIGGTVIREWAEHGEPSRSWHGDRPECDPHTSDDTRRRALAHNAVGPALNAHGEWLPLSVREAVADAVLAAIHDAADAVLDQRLNDARNQPAPGAAVTDDPPDLRQQYAAEIRDEIYEYRERTMFWEECGGITEEITRLAVRGAMTVRDTELERLQDRLAATTRAHAILADHSRRLEAQLAALAAIARGYCPHCGRGDAAPTADMYLEQVQRADNAEAAIARVRAIHVPVNYCGDVICAHCSRYHNGSPDNAPEPYPCWTIIALNQPEETPS